LDLRPVNLALVSVEILDNRFDERTRGAVQSRTEEAQEIAPVLRLVDALEEADDVQAVYANFDIPERVLEAAAP